MVAMMVVGMAFLFFKSPSIESLLCEPKLFVYIILSHHNTLRGRYCNKRSPRLKEVKRINL